MATKLVDWLNDGTLPQNKASGAWTPSAFNAGKFRQVWTPANASTHASWRPASATDWAILTTNDANGGGIWLHWDPGTSQHTLEVVSGVTGAPISGGTKVITWNAAQSITYTVDQSSATANASTLTVAGALTGNGASTGYTRVNILVGTSLFLGQWGGGGFSLLPSTFGDIDDGVDVATMTAAGSSANAGASAATLTPGAVSRAVGGSAANAGAASAALTTPGSMIAAGSSASAGATPVTLVPGGVAIGAAGSAANASAAAAAATNATLALGVFGTDFQIFGNASRPATITLTFTAGSMILVATGGKSSDISQGPTSSRGETFRRIDQVHDYPDFAGYGTAIYVCYSAVGGSTTITVPVTLFDENTTFVWEIKNGKNVRVAIWTNQANAGAGTTQTSGTAVYSAAALLSYLWWGSSPVVGGSPPPASFTAVPSRGTVIGSYLVNNSNGEVQGALATELVSAPGSNSVTWTHSPAQGAQLWILAVQEAEALPGSRANVGSAAAAIVTSNTISAAGSSATAAAAPATLAASVLVGGSAANAGSGTATLAPGAVSAATGGAAAQVGSSPATLSTGAIVAVGGAAGTASISAAQLVPGAVTRSAAGGAANAGSAAAILAPGVATASAAGATASAGASPASLVPSGAGATAGSSANASSGAAALVPSGTVAMAAAGSVVLVAAASANAVNAVGPPRPARFNYSTTQGSTMPANLVAGDLEPDLLFPLREPTSEEVARSTGVLLQPIDLTGALAASMHWKRPDATVVTRSLEIVDAPTGHVRYTWQAGDTSQVGAHRMHVLITWANGETQTVPSDGTAFVVQINPQLS